MFAQQQRNGVFCEVRAEILYSGQLVRVSESGVAVDEAGDSSEIQSKKYVRHWKPLLSNG
jgi:hypothetical protein